MNDEATIEDLGNEVTCRDFLGLTPEDEAVIAARLASHRKIAEERAANQNVETC